MHQILCFFLTVFCLSQLSSIDANSGDYKVTIIHVNDLYSAFGGVKHDNSLCDLNDLDDLDYLKKCIGGAPKIVSEIHNLRSKGPVVFINAGNNLGGFWYKQFGPKVVSDFFSELQFDVIALGLSDFEWTPDFNFNPQEGFENITEFLNIASKSSRIVSCNIQANDKYVHNFYSSVRKSATIGQNSRDKIGVIGFAKPLNITSSDGSAFDYLKIKDPINCLREESERLRRHGHEIIIAVGSGDQHLFQEIIANVPNIDLVIGSYGFRKDLSLLNERKSDGYPDLIVNENDGQKIIVTSDIFGKSVGKLSLIFDSRGNIKSSEGTLIAIDGKIEISEERTIKTDRLMEMYQRTLYLGETNVYLNASDCSTRECILGNLIADSFIYFHRWNYIENNSMWTQYLKQMEGTDVLIERLDYTRDVIALINSRMIVNSIGEVNTREYIITKASLDKMFGGIDPKIQIVVITGKTIRQLLEDYIQRSDLLQVSGLRVTYDSCQPINHRIIEISVQCRNKTEEWNQLNDTELYEVLLPQTIEINESFQVEKDLSAFELLDDFIRLRPLAINTSIENRIIFIDEKNDAFGAKTEILMTLFSTLIAVCHLRYYN